MVGLLLWLEHRAQRRLRFASLRGARAGSAEAQPVRLGGARVAAAWAVCALPVLAGFVLPVLFMLRPFLSSEVSPPWSRFGEWAFNSLRLGVSGAVLAIAIALALAFALRRRSDPLTRGVVHLAGLGYAVPGAVLAVTGASGSGKTLFLELLGLLRGKWLKQRPALVLRLLTRVLSSATCKRATAFRCPAAAAGLP